MGIVSSLVLVLGGRVVVFYMHSLLLACVIDFEDPLSSILFSFSWERYSREAYWHKSVMGMGLTNEFNSFIGFV